MTAIVDSFPLSWEQRELRELQNALCEIYPSSKAILWTVQSAGLNANLINPDQPPFYTWYDVIRLAAQTGLLRALVEFVIQQNLRSPRAEFLQGLLVDAPGELQVDYTPREQSGAPKFLASDDNITEREALLFHDDLTLEFGRISWLVDVLERLRMIGGAVCKLDTRTSTQRQAGTGFRVGSDLILTNWHVLHFGAATSAVAEFGFEDDGAGGGLPTLAFNCDCASIKGDPDQDWIVKGTEPLPEDIPTLLLSHRAEPVVQAPVFIIQHPGGQRKRVSYARNQVTDFNDQVVHYLSDTQPGSSGSPVLNDKCELIGLHRAGGRPQEVAGRQPLRKNEGIRIQRVATGLAGADVKVG